MKTLSVTFGDSSPKGRAKELSQTAAAAQKYGGRGKPLPYMTMKYVTAQKS